MSERKALITAHGISVADNRNSITAGSRGPVLIEKPTHFNRERIPKRAVYQGAVPSWRFEPSQNMKGATR